MAKAIPKTDGRRILVRIRGAQPQDGEALVDLRRQNQQVHAGLLPDYFQVTTAPLVTGPESSSLSVLLVAEGPGLAGKAILGCVRVKVVDTPPDPSMTPRRRGYIDEIVVDEGHRGAGIGTALMRAADAWAGRRDAVEMVLTVWSDNRAAEALYQRLGYQPVARVLRRSLDS